MAENTAIEWADHTFNPWIGCTKVSPGCANCYAEARDQRFAGGVHWGKGAKRQRTSAANWNLPLKWNREEEAKLVPRAEFVNPQRPRVFCASLADWLDDEVPIEWLADLLGLIHATPSLDWLLLTKRPQNFHSRIEAALEPASWPGRSRYVRDWLQGTPPANVWIGTTVEDQQRADERIPALLEIPAPARFLSCEPLLGPVDITHIRKGDDQWFPRQHIQWVICGGESGPKARPMHVNWARSLRDQCATGGVPFFFKQWGEWHPLCQGGQAIGGTSTSRYYFDDGYTHAWLGKKMAGRLLDGREHNEFPGGVQK